MNQEPVHGPQQIWQEIGRRQASPPVPTPAPRALYRDAEECLALARDCAAPERLQLLLSAIRERHARLGLPIPVPVKPIESQLP